MYIKEWVNKNLKNEHKKLKNQKNMTIFVMK